MAKPKVIKLSEKLDISKVESLLQEFKEAVEQGGSMNIDASEINRIDTAGLQLLYSFRKTLEDQGGKVLVNNASDEFMNSARLVGFDKILAFQ